MLNYRFLYSVLESSSIQTFLALIAAAGFSVLLDIIIILKLSVLIGPWIAIMVLTAGSAVGILAMYNAVEKKRTELQNSINSGIFSESLFDRYLAVLITSGFIILPGIINTITGIVLLFPRPADKLGRTVARAAGINWQEAYEHLRLNSLVE